MAFSEVTGFTSVDAPHADAGRSELATATIKKGDWLTVCSGVGATGVTAWFVSAHRGVLTKEA